MSSFKIDQLVWGKVQGFPWWPGVVSEISKPRGANSERQITVKFIGHNSYAPLNENKVADFTENQKQYSKQKQKALQEAIKTTVKIREGKMTAKEEFDRMKQKAAQGSNKKKQTKRKDSSDESDTESEESKEEKPKEQSQEQKKKAKPTNTKKGPTLNKQSSKEKKRSESRESSSSSEESKVAPPKKTSKPARNSSTKKSVQSIKEEYEEYGSLRTTRSQAKRTNVELFDGPILYNQRRGARKGQTSQSKDTSKDNSGPKSKNNKRGSAAQKKKGGTQKKGAVSKKSASSSSDSEDEEESEKSESEESRDSEDDGIMEMVKNKKEKEKKVNKSPSKNQKRGRRGSKGSMTKVNTKRKAPSRTQEKRDVYSDDSSDSEQEEEKKSNDEKLGKILSEQEEKAKKGGKKGSKLNNGKEKIQKKTKTTSNDEPGEALSFEPSAEGLTASSNTPRTFNNLAIKKLENDLETVLENFQKKFKSKKKLAEDDSDISKLVSLVQDFDQHGFNGSEFIQSELGKLFKTIHQICIDNKTQLNSKGNELVTILAKVVHKIKDKILKFVMDNSEYVEKFHQGKPQDDKPSKSTFNPADIEPISIKIEDWGDQSNDKKSHEPLPANPLNLDPADLPKTATSKSKPEASKQNSQNSNASSITPFSNQPKPSPATKNNNNTPSTSNAETLALRKKICQKMAKLFQSSYHVDKETAQEMTLIIEGKVNEFYQNSINDYKQTIKGLYKLIKNQNLKKNEIYLLKDYNYEQFTDLVFERIQKVYQFTDDNKASFLNQVGYKGGKGGDSSDDDK